MLLAFYQSSLAQPIHYTMAHVHSHNDYEHVFLFIMPMPGKPDLLKQTYESKMTYYMYPIIATQ